MQNLSFVIRPLIYAMKVFTTGAFNLCPSESCDLQREAPTTASPAANTPGYCPAVPADDVRFELYENPPREVIRAVEKIVGVAGRECAGIEYVVDKQGQWYIYDINALSVLSASFKQEYGIDGWGQLADFFIEEYHKVVAKCFQTELAESLSRLRLLPVVRREQAIPIPQLFTGSI